MTQTAQRPRRRRGEARAAIVAAAEEALRHKRLRELRVDEVMAEAGLARTIFYRHFDDLFDLVLTVAGRAFDELYMQQEQMLAKDDTGPDAVRVAVASAVTVFAEHGRLIRAVAEGAALDESIDLRYRAALERFVALTARLVPIETARALTQMNVNYLLDRFGGDEAAVSVEVATDTLAQLWTAAIASSRLA